MEKATRATHARKYFFLDRPPSLAVDEGCMSWYPEESPATAHVQHQTHSRRMDCFEGERSHWKASFHSAMILVLYVQKGREETKWDYDIRR